MKHLDRLIVTGLKTRHVDLGWVYCVTTNTLIGKFLWLSYCCYQIQSIMQQMDNKKIAVNSFTQRPPLFSSSNFSSHTASTRIVWVCLFHLNWSLYKIKKNTENLADDMHHRRSGASANRMYTP